MKNSNVGMLARRGSGRLKPEPTRSRRSWIAVVAGLASISLAAIVGVKLDARTGVPAEDIRASLSRGSSAMALSEQWTSAYKVSSSSLNSPVVDTQGTPYLLGGARTIALQSRGSQSQRSSIISNRIESQFSLGAPGSFIEFNFVGDSNGRYVLRIANRVISLHFAVMSRDRVEISRLNLRRPISGSTISVEADGRCTISSKTWYLVMPGCSDVKGIDSYSTNLLPEEILKLDYLTGAKK